MEFITIGDNLINATYQNKINGNTLVDGNVYINGTLNYVSTDSAKTQVVSNAPSMLPTPPAGAPALGQVTGTNEVAIKGYKDNEGKDIKKADGTQVTGLTNLVTVTNGAGKTHGVAVREDSTVVSGGTNSTYMKMQDDTVNFGRGSMDVAGNITGSRAPVKLTGVANGTSTYDAVNFGQLNDVAQRAYSGIAQVTAMANIPGPIAGKNYSIGVGTGYYRGNTALAIGGKANIGDMIQLQGSVGTGFGYTDSMSAGGGVSFSW